MKRSTYTFPALENRDKGETFLHSGNFFISEGKLYPKIDKQSTQTNECSYSY